MRTNANCTIYNKYISAGSEQYQRTQVRDVTWENKKSSNVLASGGNIAADQASVYILFERGINYLSPKTWQALSAKAGKWTLQVGDFIVKGLVEDVITPSFTITALKAKYDDVLAVSSVDVMDMGSQTMRHWQIGAK